MSSPFLRRMRTAALVTLVALPAVPAIAAETRLTAISSIGVNESQTPGGTPPVSSLSSPFTITIVPTPALASNLPALAAFNRAAQQWTSFIADPITVTVNAGLAPLGAGIIGSTSSLDLYADYNTIRDQLVADADADDSILSSLPTAAQFTTAIPSGRSFDGNLLLTKANAKAIGFTDLDDIFGVSDGEITFSSAFSFDFDNSDGIGPGQMDFETVAAHEIGHLLGFISIVDDIDFGLTAVKPTTLDLFRFRNLNGSKPTNGAQFTSFARNLVPGDDDVFSDTISEFRMSSGQLAGDGKQASHWEADELSGFYLGIMDPTLANGQIEQITGADRLAMDLIGYDVVVPEPSMASFLMLSACTAMMRRRGRDQAPSWPKKSSV